MLKPILLLILSTLVLAACGGAPGDADATTESSVATSSEALLVPLVEHVQPGTLQMASPRGRTSEDPAHPTPNLTLISYVIASGCSTYSTTAKTAIMCVTTAQFNAVNAADAAAFADPTHHHVDVSLTYDDSAMGANKPVTAFSVTLL